jgi:hypothetical protein
MTTTELAAVVSRVTYKKGWSFWVHEEHEGPVLRITAGVPDRGDPRCLTHLGIDTHIPHTLIHTEADLVEFLRWRLTRIENHEVREFLCLDGARCYDPHTVSPPT